MRPGRHRLWGAVVTICYDSRHACRIDCHKYKQIFTHITTIYVKFTPGRKKFATVNLLYYFCICQSYQKMQYLHVYNFKCYRDFNIKFSRGINLFVGDNAVGKTSLLRATKNALDAFFSGFSDPNTKMIPFEADDFRKIYDNGTELPMQPIRLVFSYFEDIFPCESQELSKDNPKGSRKRISGIAQLRDASRHLMQTFYLDNPRTTALPLFAAFSTEDIHSKRKIQGEKFKDYTPLNSFGYYECLNADGLLKYWRNRLFVLKEAVLDEFTDTSRAKAEIATVQQAVLKALGPEGCGIIDAMTIRPAKKAILFRLSDGRVVSDQMLSDGYKRLVNIVVDLALRSYILNNNIAGFDPLTDTKGTVIIDELDLHLHPSLQAKVLPSLAKTFPNLQFIVSTHSPLVMSGVNTDEANSVFKLMYDTDTDTYEAAKIDTYGMDASSIIEQTFGLAARTPHVQDQLKEIDDCIDNDDYKTARLKLNLMREKFGDRLPEITKSETALFFLDPDNAEDNQK